MSKQVLLCLLTVVISYGMFFPLPSSSSCTTVSQSSLSVDEMENTSAQLHYTPIGESSINQFRIRQVGTSQWRYSTIHTHSYRQIDHLVPNTPYEFQVSYICPNQFWTAFSASAQFTTQEEREEEQRDSIPTSNWLMISDRQVLCEDSLVCVELSAISSNSTIHTVLSWDVQALELDRLDINPIHTGSIFYQADSFHLSLGKLPINFITGWADKEDGVDDTLSVASICYTPFFGQVTQSTIELTATSILLPTETSRTDTLLNPPTLSGRITFDSCVGIELGGGTCETVNLIGFTTNEVTDTTAYIYNSHHNLAFNNQFRYRKKGTDRWIYTDIRQEHFRRLTDLLPGTIYEFQANQECPDSSYSNYSLSSSFSTHGESEDTNEEDQEQDKEVIEIVVDEACAPVDSTELNVSTIKQYFAYVYAPQPLGVINNQLRYRPVGSSFWLYTSISPTYYRYLRGLRDGTLYEYQVSQECSEGVWSVYSGSYRFTTLPSIN